MPDRDQGSADSPRRLTADEIRYWQSRPPWERFEAIAELSAAEYLRNHPEDAADPPQAGWAKAKVQILPFPEGLDEK